MISVHDWTRVPAGIFHDFHSSWIVAMKGELNQGILPRGFYALAEHITAERIPDVLTLRSQSDGSEPFDADGATAVAVAPPKVKLTVTSERNWSQSRQKTVVIRHVSEDQIVALMEIVSPGNKSSRKHLPTFLTKFGPH